MSRRSRPEPIHRYGVDQVRMLRRRFTVRTSLIEAAGVPPRLGSPKTAAAERTITLPKIVTETLGIHFHSHPPVDGLVWTTERGVPS